MSCDEASDGLPGSFCARTLTHKTPKSRAILRKSSVNGEGPVRLHESCCRERWMGVLRIWRGHTFCWMLLEAEVRTFACWCVVASLFSAMQVLATPPGRRLIRVHHAPKCRKGNITQTVSSPAQVLRAF